MMKARIKLGLDVRILSQPMSGVGRYVAVLLEGLRRRDIFDIVLFTDTPLREEYKHLVDGLPLVCSSEKDRKKWRSDVLPRQLKEHKIQVYHATWDKGVPYGRPCAVVMTIYDLFCISTKNTYLSFLKKLKRWFDLRREVSACEKILTISEFTKVHIMRDLGVSQQRIEVTLLDCDRSKIDAVMHKTLDRPRYEALIGREGYFVSLVGRLNDKRKNVPFLLRSYAKFLNTNASHTCPKLLIIGKYQSEDASYQELMRIVKKEKIEGQVVFLGHVPDEELYWTLKYSKAMVFTSLFEGFGIPIVEAFYLGVPVITANSSAMTEIASDGAAILVDPTDEDSLASAMSKLAFSPGEAERLVKQGMVRVRSFDWETSIDKIMHIYEGALAS
jgi:glycosyltransferase involved in cell wall biosynthesis